MSEQEAGAAATAASAAPTPCVPRPLPPPSPLRSPSSSYLFPPSLVFSDPAIARVCSLFFLAFSLPVSFFYSLHTSLLCIHPFSFFYRVFPPLPLFCISLVASPSSYLFFLSPFPLFSSLMDQSGLRTYLFFLEAPDRGASQDRREPGISPNC